MNLYLHINDLRTTGDEHGDIHLNDDIRFLYSKQNTVMDGEFTKILFSRENFTMNGLYLLFPIMIDKRANGKAEYANHIRSIQNASPPNSILLRDFCLLERKLLAQYKKFNHCEKHMELSFSKQISTKQIRVYTEMGKHSHVSAPTFIIKISGIWESHDRVGITYKIVEVSP